MRTDQGTDEYSNDETVSLVPVEAAGQTVLLRVRPNAESAHASFEEQEVAGWGTARIDGLFAGLAGVAEDFATRFESSGAKRMRLKFGCDVAVKSGSLIAIIGNASTTASFGVEPEYESSDKPESAAA